MQSNKITYTTVIKIVESRTKKDKNGNDFYIIKAKKLHESEVKTYLYFPRKKDRWFDVNGKLILWQDFLVAGNILEIFVVQTDTIDKPEPMLSIYPGLPHSTQREEEYYE